MEVSDVVPQDSVDLMDIYDSVDHLVGGLEATSSDNAKDVFQNVFSHPHEVQESLKPPQTKQMSRLPVVATSQVFMTYLNAKEQEKQAVESGKIKRREDRLKKKQEQEMKKKEKKHLKLKTEKRTSQNPHKKRKV